MYYPWSENKGADQLRSYCEADLRLCFRIGKNPVFSPCGSYNILTSNNHLFIWMKQLVHCMHLSRAVKSNASALQVWNSIEIK